MAGTRGASWRREETLELLAPGGEARKSRRVSSSPTGTLTEGLAAKGYQRTALECSTKTKGLHLEYKKVVANNSKSGTSWQTCPYDEELSRILQRRASEAGRRLPHSFREKTVPSTNQESTLPALPPKKPPWISFPFTSKQHIYIHPASGIGSLAHRKLTGFPPEVNLSDLSPKSHLALIRVRTKHISAVQKIGEEMMWHSTRQHKALLEAGRKDQEDVMRPR
ncbi:UNVERIFIED_CONTAM: hypothetical protein K2H54_004212 [Gekko kuhli]